MGCYSHAAEITWSTPQNITGQVADFDITGTPVYQWNAGTSTITIDPTGLNLTFSPGALFNGTTYNNVDPHNRGGSNEYEQLLGEMTYTGSDASITLTGLTAGHQYRLQLWMADTRSCCQGRQKTYSGGTGTSQVTLDSGPPSQFIIGTFVADAATQEIQFIGSGAEHPQYNALALRTLGAPTPTLTNISASDGNLSSDAGVNIASGDSSTLVWEFADADSVTLTEGGALPYGTTTTGNVTVSPTVTTTYTFTAINTHGSTIKSITVYVDAPVTAPRLNEIVADNVNGLLDEDDSAEDWVELYNPNAFVIDAGNYRLTDDSTLTTTWAIPAGTAIPAKGYIVIFASGKNRTSSELHTDFRLDADGDYLAITSADGITVLGTLPHDYPTNPLYPKIPEDKSYGYNDSSQIRYFGTPSPGEDNDAGFNGFVGDTQFSHDRGFYDTSFNLVITSTTGTATIRYTTDGSPPTETTGTVYAGPISISQTTVIRALAYDTGYEPTNIDTHTYIFGPDVIASNVMDTGITQNGTYGPQMNDSLKALPIISLNIEDPNGVDNSSEHNTSVEMIFADGTKGFQVDAGVSYFGGYFTNFDKKNFRLYFRNDYGPGKLNYPLFDGFENGRQHGILPVESFDALDLRTGSHDMALRGAYLSNRFTDDALLEMGNISPHGRFVHLFRNGVYWGQYHLRERWNASMASEYFGGKKSAYEAVNGNANVGGWSSGVAYDGDGSGWTQIKNLANGSTPWSSLQSRLDLQSYLDFWILYDFGSSENEYRCFGQPIDNGVGMKFYLNDADGWTHPTGIAQNNDGGGPGNILGRLESEAHPDFKTYFADRIYAAYFHDGAFAADTNVERIQRLFGQTQLSFLCESARWGYRTPQTYNSYHNNLINTQFPGQTASRLNDLKNSGRYPNVDAPEFNQNGGVVASGFGVFLESPSGGTIYYTTDGSDPRLPGGTINSNATSLSVTGGNISIIQDGSNWKYLDNGSNQGTAWKESGFNDISWESGNAQLGYGDGDEATSLFYGSDSNNKYITTYFRKKFNVADTSNLAGLTLEIMRDDGAVVYLNGTEVVRTSMPDGVISHTTLANVTAGGSDESAFNQFSVPVNLLVNGDNTIAVEIHQAAVTSSDISFDLRLNATTGNAVPDLVLTSDTLLQARVLSGGTWSAIHPAQFVVSQPPVAPQVGNLVVSEIHYHPSNPTTSELTALPTINDDDFEFIELMNIGSQPLRLDDCIFTDGFAYVFPEDSIIQPGGRMILAKNILAFSLRHPNVIAHGQFADGKLSNSGETIILENTSGAEILNFSYHDGTDNSNPGDTLWSTKPDGSGESLVMINPAAGGDLSNPLFWRASALNHGAPGNSDVVQLPDNPQEDLDGDGYVALLEQTLNSSSNDASDIPGTTGSLDTLTDSQTYLTLTFVRNALTPTNIVVQTATDLKTWEDNAIILSRIQHSDGTETLTYRFPTPWQGNGHFMRVKVSE